MSTTDTATTGTAGAVWTGVSTGVVTSGFAVPGAAFGPRFTTPADVLPPASEGLGGTVPVFPAS